MLLLACTLSLNTMNTFCMEKKENKTFSRPDIELGRKLYNASKLNEQEKQLQLKHYSVNQVSLNNYFKDTWNRQAPFIKFGYSMVWEGLKLISVPFELAVNTLVPIQRLEFGSKLLSKTDTEEIKNALGNSSFSYRIKSLNLYDMSKYNVSKNKDNLFKASLNNRALWVDIYKYKQLNLQQRKQAVTSMGNYMRYYGPTGEIVIPGATGSFCCWYASKLTKKYFGTSIVGMIQKNKNTQKMIGIIGGGAIAFKVLKKSTNKIHENNTDVLIHTAGKGGGAITLNALQKPIHKTLKKTLEKGPFDSLFEHTVPACTYTDDEDQALSEEKKNTDKK